MTTQETSALAYADYKGNLERDYKIILKVLSETSNLTAFGIARLAYYEDEHGRRRKIDYLAVSRRMSELRKRGKVELTGEKFRDNDNALRATYKIKL